MESNKSSSLNQLVDLKRSLMTIKMTKRVYASGSFLRMENNKCTLNINNYLINFLTLSCVAEAVSDLNGVNRSNLVVFEAGISWLYDV